MKEVPHTGRPTPDRIQADDPEQLRIWSNSLGVSPAELKRIIVEVGNDPDKVRAYLNTRA
ncbi:DUF3606 domain-containing protein [Ramlibacter tataouinensis]|uniref:DUF3606 domain-containing protein n=1 Tax=Ramlibacter tataouinensis TaxID=94132 RepID=UPI001305438F|nr:DUF3606 domain-containing protein [Ramlibacter tataouinensis]